MVLGPRPHHQNFLQLLCGSKARPQDIPSTKQDARIFHPKANLRQMLGCSCALGFFTTLACCFHCSACEYLDHDNGWIIQKFEWLESQSLPPQPEAEPSTRKRRLHEQSSMSACVSSAAILLYTHAATIKGKMKR